MKNNLMLTQSGVQFISDNFFEDKLKRSVVEEIRKAEKKEHQNALKETKKKLIINEANRMYRLTLMKADFFGGSNFNSRSDLGDDQTSASSAMKNNRERRYPQAKIGPFKFPCSVNPERATSPGNLNKRKTKIKFGEEDSIPEPLGLVGTDSEVGQAIQCIIEANKKVITSPLYKSQKSERMKRHAENWNKTWNATMGAELVSPEQVLNDAIEDLVHRSEEVGHGVALQVSERLKPLRKLKPSQLSENCTHEIGLLQKLGSLFQKHADLEYKFKKRRELEKKGREELCEQRVRATGILQKISKIGTDFDQLAESLEFGSRGKLPIGLVQENLRKLKNIKLYNSEKQTHNERCHTEPVGSMMSLQEKTGSSDNQQARILVGSSPRLPCISQKSEKGQSATKSLIYKHF